MNWIDNLEHARQDIEAVKEEIAKENYVGKYDMLEEINGALHHIGCTLCKLKRYQHG